MVAKNDVLTLIANITCTKSVSSQMLTQYVKIETGLDCITILVSLCGGKMCKVAIADIIVVNMDSRWFILNSTTNVVQLFLTVGERSSRHDIYL